MSFVLYQDQVVKREDVQIDLEDRGYHFGDGIYEVVRIYEGQAFTAKEHFERFFQSAEKIDMKVPYGQEQFISLMEELIEKNSIGEGIVYLQMTRGASPRNHLYDRSSSPIITGFAREIASVEEKLQKGIDVWMTKDIRWLRCDIKTLNLLGNIMAKREAADNDCYEAVQHRDGTVTEGSSSNFFIVKDNALHTHPATNLILNGITRQVVLKLAGELGIPVVEEAFTLDDVKAASEAFITSTTSEVMPVNHIKGDIDKTFSSRTIIDQLQKAFTAYIEKEKGIVKEA